MGGLQMDEHEAEGFFPERKALRARRLAGVVDMQENPSTAFTRRVSTGVSMSVAVLSPIFASAIGFGWIPVELSLEIVVCAASLVLVVGGALAAVNLRRAFRRPDTRSP